MLELVNTAIHTFYLNFHINFNTELSYIVLPSINFNSNGRIMAIVMQLS